MLGWMAEQSQPWIDHLKNMDADDMQAMLRRYSALGPLPGILLPVLEALIPLLPLVVIVVANASAYGLWAGFFYSWLGACIGAMIVFLLARRFAGNFGTRIRKRYPKSERFFGWIERQGFTPIFILSCFPFSPSALINIASGMSKIPLHTFLTAILLGKAVMIFTLSFIGHDLEAMIRQPWRIVAAVVVLLILWWGGKKLEARFSQ